MKENSSLSLSQSGQCEDQDIQWIVSIEASTDQQTVFFFCCIIDAK